MELCPKISEVFDIFEDLGMRPVDFLKLPAAMKRHLRLRRFELKGRVPCTTVPTIEPTAARMSICKRRVHDMGVGDAKYQFMDANAGQQT